VTTKNFVVKNGLTTGNINLYAGNSTISANSVVANLSVPATANLGAVGNITITGGSSGQFLQTNGSGVLSWATASSSGAGALGMSVDTFTGNGVQTNFTLSSTPDSVNYTIATVQGVVQPRSYYSVVGSTLTFSTAPPSTSLVEITTITGNASGSSTYANANVANYLPTFTGNLTAGNINLTFTTSSTANLGNAVVANYFVGNASLLTGLPTGYSYTAVSANATMVKATRYIVDTSSSNITLTLPISATLGDEIGIIDGTGNASSHQITVGRNGGNIQGAASDMIVNSDRAAFVMVYYNSTQGWLLTQV
jgi:hypothetical protein